MGIFNNERVKVMQTFCQKHGDNVGLEDRRIVRPPEHLDNVGAEWTAELYGLSPGHDKFRKVDDDGNLSGSSFTSPDHLKIQRTKKVAVDQLQSGAGLTRLLHRGLIAQDLR